MAYTPNTWQDRTGTGLNKFTDQNGNEYEFTPTPDEITQQGTPFSAAWLNHIERGIKDNSDDIAEINDNFPVSIANGGTGATTAAAAREALNAAELGSPRIFPAPDYNSTSSDTESAFNTWLEDLVEDMQAYEVRFITWRVYPAIMGYKNVGILFKNSDKFASLLSFTYEANDFFIKVKKDGTWQNTVNIRQILSDDSYGNSLPAAGTPGRIFFLKA